MWGQSYDHIHGIGMWEGSHLALWHCHGDGVPGYDVIERKEVVVCYEHRDATKPHCIHHAWAPPLVATGTQTKLTALQCPNTS